MFDLLVGSTKEDDDEQAESGDPWRRLEHHARILKSHEERLESNITKIEIIREMLEQKKGQYFLTSFSLIKKCCISFKELSFRGAKIRTLLE